MALRVSDASLDASDLMRVRFDNSANSAPDIGDDELHATTAGLADLHYTGTSTDGVSSSSQ